MGDGVVENEGESISYCENVGKGSKPKKKRKKNEVKYSNLERG